MGFIGSRRSILRLFSRSFPIAPRAREIFIATGNTQGSDSNSKKISDRQWWRVVVTEQSRSLNKMISVILSIWKVRLFDFMTSLHTTSIICCCEKIIVCLLVIATAASGIDANSTSHNKCMFEILSWYNATSQLLFYVIGSSSQVSAVIILSDSGAMVEHLTIQFTC